MRNMHWKLKNKICFVLKVLCAICLVTMVIINVMQVLCRYFISLSFIWAEDLSVYLIHWIVTFSMPLLWLMKDHMVMDISNAILPKRVLDLLDLLIDLVGLYFGFVLAQKGFYAAKVNKGYIMSVVGYDEMIKYIPYGVAGILLSCASGINLFERFFINKNTKEEVQK